METFEYGNDKTIHDTKVLDVEVDKHGNVVSVWFRCQMLPFNATVVSDTRAAKMRAAMDDYGKPLELHAVKLKRSTSDD